MTKIAPAILCGGSGTRLWPVSRASRPKQFHPLVTERTLLGETIARALTLPGVDPKDLIIISGESLTELVREEMEASGASDALLIVEPVGKNTAPAAALASFAALERGAEQVLLLASDHHVANISAFRATVDAGAKLAARDFVVTFGIKPDSPHTGYGYIQRGASEGPGFRVAKFKEKPDAKTAEELVARGDHDWNAGIFLFKPDVFLRELSQHEPSVRETVERAWKGAARSGGVLVPERTAWAETKSISIDYAVAERTAMAAIVPADMGWSDVGGWAALWDIGEKDPNRNVTLGDVLAIDAHDCYVRAEDRLVALVGVDNLVVIETAEAVCIAPRDRAEEVKRLVNALSEADRKDKL
jgi:mannose-1-phosphate guanylyltransferase/mannose-6-phosphate isomerase